MSTDRAQKDLAAHHRQMAAARIKQQAIEEDLHDVPKVSITREINTSRRIK